MERTELKTLWKNNKLTTRFSYAPEHIFKICESFGVSESEVKKLIYTKPRWREQTDGSPRIDGEDLLLLIAKKHNILPDEKYIALSNRLFGEGSRREAIEWAYIGRE
jgi:hypothetical protein